MIHNESLAAAVFVVGMEGIKEEPELVQRLAPDARQYFIGAPGDVAGEYASCSSERIRLRAMGRLDDQWSAGLSPSWHQSQQSQNRRAQMKLQTRGATERLSIVNQRGN